MLGWLGVNNNNNMKDKTKNILQNILFAVIVMTITFGLVRAGDLFPSGETISPTFYTLRDIYDKLTDNTSSAEEGDHDLDSSGTPDGTFYTLKQIYEAIPTLDASKILYPTTYMGVEGTLIPSQTLKTGQTTCYDVIGNSISCDNTGQDGAYQKGQTRSYADNEDGTVTDNSTGLMWKKCSEGLSGDNCATGVATRMNWTTATSTCESDTTAAYTDWRLPNIKELLSLVDYGKVYPDPAINTTLFPATDTNYSYWTSTSFIETPIYARSVDFYDGAVYYVNKSNQFYVRCVRDAIQEEIPRR